MSTVCAYFPRCTGCASRDIPYSDQKLRKISHLGELLRSKSLHFPDEIAFLSAGDSGLRSRVDFTVEYDSEKQRHIFGFYDAAKALLQIEQCLQLSPELQKIYSEFIQFHFFAGDDPLKKGSVRLRVGPGGLKGCWLDFSNLDIKAFLDDGVLLRQLLGAGFVVEMGQKSKQVLQTPQGLKLSDPKPLIWFKTKNLELLSSISDFTQPSAKTGDLLVDVVLTWLKKTGGSSLLEFGPGIGPFTLQFLNSGFSVEACEVNASACSHLQANAAAHGLGDKLLIRQADFHRPSDLRSSSYDVIFVNPARAGLKQFAEKILTVDSKCLIYVSCFPESMAADLALLTKKYKIRETVIVDQFPQTAHFETCVLLEKSSQ